MSDLPYPLDPYGMKSSSQNDEDGIIAEIIKHIPMPRYFVEIGCDPHEANCLYLQRQGWKGLFLDAEKSAPWIRKEWISAGNIMEVLDKYKVPSDFGILSIDIDGQDFWVWRELEGRFYPCLVVIEYNGKLAIDHDYVIPRDDNFKIQGQLYGASLKVMNELAVRKGYTLVYANGVNAFFVRTYFLDNRYDFQYEKLYRRWPTEHIHDPLKMGFIRWAE